MNLIVTCPRHFETEASDEISVILEEMGEESPKIEKSSLSGILMIDAKVDPIQVSHKIREKIQMSLGRLDIFLEQYQSKNGY